MLFRSDIGAHFGTLTCALSQIFNKVQAFEANKDSVRYLYANAALRQSGAIEVHHIGIYSKEELLSFASKEEQEVEINRDANEEDYYNSSNSGGLMFVTQGTGVNAIRAVPLDSYQFQDVGFIKIDCQGADGEVIKGALKTISSCKPFIVFEWEDKLAQSHQVSLLETMNSLKNLGYIINELYRHNEKQIDYVAIPPKE